MSLYNLLEINSLVCPRCNNVTSAESEFRFGYANQDRYSVGGILQWGGKGAIHRRPPDGIFTGEGYVECPICQEDFWIIIYVIESEIKSFEIDYSKVGYIP